MGLQHSSLTAESLPTHDIEKEPFISRASTILHEEQYTIPQEQQSKSFSQGWAILTRKCTTSWYLISYLLECQFVKGRLHRLWKSAPVVYRLSLTYHSRCTGLEEQGSKLYQLQLAAMVGFPYHGWIRVDIFGCLDTLWLCHLQRAAIHRHSKRGNRLHCSIESFCISCRIIRSPLFLLPWWRQLQAKDRRNRGGSAAYWSDLEDLDSFQSYIGAVK